MVRSAIAKYKYKEIYLKPILFYMLTSSINYVVEEAAARPKLNLLPRSVAAPVADTSQRNRDLFGGARPREEVLKSRPADENSS